MFFFIYFDLTVYFTIFIFYLLYYLSITIIYLLFIYLKRKEIIDWIELKVSF